MYVDTCVPFGTRHGSQIFQRLSEAIRYIMRQKDFVMVDYIDDYVGMGVPSIAWVSYNALTELMGEQGLTIIEKKLVPPSTQVTCLGVLIDKGTLSIPPEKLHDITQVVCHWLGKDVTSKRQLQSILGLLLYVHKCVKPAHIFLNRMLDLLRSLHGRKKIELTHGFKRDLRWFAKFLPAYNGIYNDQQGLNPLTDSCVRKFFKRINIALELPSNYFTFHDLRRSGATLAYHSHVPIQDIKRHGTWSSDCVWQYTQSDHSSGRNFS